MFVVTRELAEFLYELGCMLRFTSKPRNVVMTIMTGLIFTSIYFGAIILADLMGV